MNTKNKAPSTNKHPWYYSWIFPVAVLKNFDEALIYEWTQTQKQQVFTWVKYFLIAGTLLQVLFFHLASFRPGYDPDFILKQRGITGILLLIAVLAIQFNLFHKHKLQFFILKIIAIFGGMVQLAFQFQDIYQNPNVPRLYPFGIFIATLSIVRFNTKTTTFLCGLHLLFMMIFGFESYFIKKEWSNLTTDASYEAITLIIILSSTIIQELQAKIQTLEINKLKTSKLESLGNMAGGVCHEINNPLMAIKGKIDLFKLQLEMEKTIDLNTQKFFDSINHEIGRISYITKNLLIYSDPVTPTREELLTINEILASVESEIKVPLRVHNSKLIINMDQANIPDALFPSHTLKTAIINLLLNGIDAVKEQDVREVSVDVKIDISDTMEIYIHDSGAPIPPENYERIFDPFYTTKPQGSGTGLGLSVSKALLECMDGTIKLSPNKDKKCFIISIKQNNISMQQKKVANY